MRGSTYLGAAWHGWYHVVGNTYGTWLYGDGRGFRTRHHREHVEGDYKNPPPPGVYNALRACSERAMNRAPVVLAPKARAAACLAFAAALRFHHIELIELSIGAKHYHFLARFPCTPQWIERITGAHSEAHGLQSVGFNRFDRRRKSSLDDPPRHYTGIAKKESARELSRLALVPPGGAWAKRCHPIPIESRSHQVSAACYIFKHHREGAAVLSILERRRFGLRHK